MEKDVVGEEDKGFTSQEVHEWFNKTVFNQI
jgi:hypothetical protein